MFVVFYDVHLDLISCMSTKEFLMYLNYMYFFLMFTIPRIMILLLQVFGVVATHYYKLVLQYACIVLICFS